MRTFAILTLAFAAVFGWAMGSVRPKAIATPAVTTSPSVAPPPMPLPAAPPAPPPATAGTIAIDRSGTGHFLVPGDIDGYRLTFVVDTGASEVALSRADARAAGIDVDALAFDHQAQTANGPVRTAEIRLRHLRVGDIELADVPAVVLDIQQGVAPLLGQSFLGRIDKVAIEGDRMTLTKL